MPIYDSTTIKKSNITWQQLIDLYNERGEMIEHLEAENKKLREERNHWKVEQTHAFSNWEDAHKRVIELESENEKLRELVVRLWNNARFLDANKQIDGLRMNNIFKEEMEQAFIELGIEVDL